MPEPPVQAVEQAADRRRAARLRATLARSSPLLRIPTLLVLILF